MARRGRPSGNPAIAEARRMRAAEMILSGKQPAEIAATLAVDRRGVRRWKAAVLAGGPQALKARPNRGHEPRLSEGQRRELVEGLLAGAVAAGFPTDLWTCPRVADDIGKRFGVHYHPDYVGRLLHALGWSPQRPARPAAERNEPAIRAWVQQGWPAIKKKRGNSKRY